MRGVQPTISNIHISLYNFKNAATPGTMAQQILPTLHQNACALEKLAGKATSPMHTTCRNGQNLLGHSPKGNYVFKIPKIDMDITYGGQWASQ